jgi:ketosteroid isomerase-like protein
VTVRGYFENNLSDVHKAISQAISEGARMMDRLCQIMDEDIETKILDESALVRRKKYGKLEELIDAAIAGIDRCGFLSEDGKEISFGLYFIFRFREGQCSDFEL